MKQQEKSAELIKVLAQKAWESTAFKEQLIKNPVATIEEITGEGSVNLNGKKIVVDDQTDENTIYFNIPAQVSLDEMQLTEEQLEMIAGGITPSYVVGFVVAVGLCAIVDYVRSE